MRSHKKRAISLFLILALLFSFPGLTAYAANSIQERGAAKSALPSCITSLSYGLPGIPIGDISIESSDNNEYNVTIPDNLSTSSYQCLRCVGDTSKSITLYSTYSDDEKTTINEKFNNHQMAEQDKYNKLELSCSPTYDIVDHLNAKKGLFGPYDFYLVVGTNWSSETEKFNRVDAVLHLIHRIKVTLKTLVVYNGDTKLDFAGETFSSTNYDYAVTLQPNQTEFKLQNTANSSNYTKISYTSGAKSLTPQAGTTFKLEELEHDSYGNPYIQIKVEGANAVEGNEAIPSTYTIQFTKSAVEPPMVEIVGDATKNFDKGSSNLLEVTVTNKREDDGAEYSYQWYSSNSIPKPSQDSSKLKNPSKLTDETESTYHPDTKLATRNPTAYWCDVTKTVQGIGYTVHSPVFAVNIIATYAEAPIILLQPEDIACKENEKVTFIIAGDSTESYPICTTTAKWYHIDENGQPQEVEGETRGAGTAYNWMYACSPDTSKVGTYEYYCVVTNTDTNSITNETYTKDAESIHVTLTVQSIPGTEELNGSGTVENPYQISTIEDLKAVKSIVESGYTLEGTYLKLMNDLTLPADWDPIGALKPGSTSTLNGKNVNPFSGTFDGDGHKLTIEPGGTGIFNYVRKAEIKNLKVYGEKISGSALITGSFADYGVTGKYDMYANPWRVKIDNVTLLSGSKTSGAGFLFGGGSGINTVWITNSTVEAGCTVGGASFIYDLNGYIINCTSKADVKPAYFGAGGLAGCKGQTMGACAIQNSSFEGTIVSEGYAGGIIGSGYGARGYREGDQSAPNSPVVTVNNCYVHADITGTEMVGGIIGGEPAVLQCWGNGEGTISNNVFVGKIHTTGQCDAGGIIGYIRGFDQYQFLHNNYYVADCGVDSGIGYIGTVLYAVESAKPTGMQTGTNFQLDNKYGFTEQPKFEEYCAAVPRDKLNDLVDTLNNAVKSFGNWKASDMGPVFDTTIATPYELTIRGDYKTDYVIGDELDLSGAVITVTLTDGSTKSLDWKELTVEGYDKNTRGAQKVTLSYGGASCDITLTVLKAGTGTIDVYFTLLGDSAHGTPTSDRHTHTLKGENLTTWLSRKAYEVDQNATVKDVLEKALRDNKIGWTNPSGNYVESITYGTTTLAEFTNGKLSGWMYTLNGVHTDLGVSEQYLEDGSEIIFHYTDNYNIEDGSEKWEKPKDTTLLTPEVTADASGNAKANVGKSDMDDAIEVAQEQGSGSIVVNPEVKGTAKNVTVDIPKASAGDMANAGLELDVWTKNGNVTLPAEALKSLYQSSGYGNITVSVADAGSGKTAVEVAVGGKAVSDVTGGLTVTLPDLGDGDVVVIVGADGSETIVKKSLVESYQVKALLDGSCTVAVRNNAKSFTDVSGKSWYADEVEFASSHELFNGTSSSTFSPDSPMTRGMLATVLWRLEDEARASGGAGFSDVAGNTWYTEGVAWASANKIVDGYGGGIFGPDNSITRQELATMLYRYAKQMDMNTAATGSLHDFSDAGKVAAWSKSAMQWAVGNGILKGYDNGILNPNGNASRAEVATMLQRLVRLMVG